MDQGNCCHEMNGAPLPLEHGGTCYALIAPGWYGVANAVADPDRGDRTSGSPGASWA